MVSKTINVPVEGMLGLSVIVKASSVAPALVPFSVAYTDVNGNAVLTVVPLASAVPASTNAIEYNAIVGVPIGAYTAVFTYAALSRSATGGYTETIDHEAFAF